MFFHPGVEFSPADPPRVVITHNSRGGQERNESKLVRGKGFGDLVAAEGYPVVSGILNWVGRAQQQEWSGGASVEI